METTDRRTAPGDTAGRRSRTTQSSGVRTPATSAALTVAQVRALRGEIVDVLSRKVDGVQVAGTARWLAAELGGTSPNAVGFVAAVLADLQRDGLVTTRTLRSGEVLWKLTDEHHAKWQELRTSLAGTSAGQR